MSYLKLGATTLACLALTAFLWADESDELRERAEVMRREAAELAERGHTREAASLKRKAMTMLKKAERLGDSRSARHSSARRKAEMSELKRLLDRLRQEEKELEEIAGQAEQLSDVRRKAEAVEMELRQLSRGAQHEPAGPGDEMARRLEHLRIAQEHLQHAGLHEVAEHVAERAEATQRELRERQRDHDGDLMREVLKQLDEIRHEVGRLRHEVNDLRKQH